MKYSNPVITGFHPDPSVCRVDDNYYLVTSSFEYFPGIPLFHSKDLIHWEQIGNVLSRKSQLPLERTHSYIPSQGIYAPTIRYHDGKFYVVSTNISAMITFYVWTEDIRGPWSDPVVIEGWSGIDPSLHFSNEGKVYITGASFPTAVPEGIYQAEIDIQSGKLLTEPKFIWGGTGGSSAEAPHLFEKDGWFYLLIAEGGTEYGHMSTIARSSSPYGPFESNPANPILSNRSTNKTLQGTGHADFVQDTDDSWWAVFLGFRTIPGTKFHCLGRETNLVPVTWDENGWPVIGDKGQVESENDSRNLPVTKEVIWKQKEDFNSEKLSDEWNFYRNPVESSWSLSEKPGYLTLYGQKNTLSEDGSPAFVGRRQQHMECKISTQLSFDPVDDGEEAGMTVFMNENYHYDFYKVFKDGKAKIIFRRKVGSLWKVEKEIDHATSDVELKINVTPESFKFSFTDKNGNNVEMGEGECALLSTEIAGGFTGLYFGLYATGNGNISKTPAHFDYFNYSI